jgi:zinc transport system permease protein
VISIKIVGIILVTALVVLPASFGLLVSTRVRGVIGFGTLFAIFSMIGGLFLSYVLDLPAGATMVVLGTGIYFVSLLLCTRQRH